MTVQQLLNILVDMSLEQLENDLSVYSHLDDEFYPVKDFFISGNDDVATGILDAGSLVIEI